MGYGHDTYDDGELERTLKNTFNVIWQTVSRSEFWQVVLKIALTFILIIIAVKLWRFIRLMVSEMHFASALKRAADKKGWEFKRLHFPIFAFFRSYEGADIVIKGSKAKLNIKYLPYQPIKKNVHIEGSDKITFSKPWALLHLLGRGGYGMPNAPNAHNAEFFLRHRRAKLSFGKVNGTCVWVIPSKCFRLTCLSENGNSIDTIGNGYRWHDGSFFYEQKIIMKYLDGIMNGQV